MATTSKTSVALGKPELLWAQQRAKRTRKSLSAVVSDSLRSSKQAEAREEMLKALAGKKPVRDDEVARILREWD